jgi:hypothetical protein
MNQTIKYQALDDLKTVGLTANACLTPHLKKGGCASALLKEGREARAETIRRVFGKNTQAVAETRPRQREEVGQISLFGERT